MKTVKGMKREFSELSHRVIGCAIDEPKGIHEAQLLTYMKLSGIKQGFLINFNVERLKDGLRSFVL